MKKRICNLLPLYNKHPRFQQEKLKPSIGKIFAIMHRSVWETSQRMLLELKRHNYVTPTNYLELVAGYKEWVPLHCLLLLSINILSAWLFSALLLALLTKCHLQSNISLRNRLLLYFSRLLPIILISKKNIVSKKSWNYPRKHGYSQLCLIHFVHTLLVGRKRWAF